MHPSSLAAVASLLAVLLWWSSRRRPAPLLQSTDTQAVAALNRAQISLVQQRATARRRAKATPGLPLPAPGDRRGRELLIQHLRLSLQGDRTARLAAMACARAWGDRAALPFLHRGLRDVDPAVVQEAAAGLSRFRGRTSPAAVSQLVAPLPRNVALTR